jgi:hypothetical protein
LGSASSSPYFAAVVGSSNRRLVIVEVITAYQDESNTDLLNFLKS